MVTAAQRERVHGDIVRLVHRGLGVHELWQAAARTLGRAVPFDGTCLVTMDPAVLLPTGEVVADGLPGEAMARLTEIELHEPDVNKFAALARRALPAAGLGEATAGDLDRSLRQRELRRPHGFEDELRVALTGPTGTWGAVTLSREARSPHFTTAEVRFVASLAGPLADGVRQSMMLAGPAATPGPALDAGLLVLTADDSVEMANREADRWLDALGAGDGTGPDLPVSVRVVADRARRTCSPDRDAGLARVRVRTPAGRWVVVRASMLGDDPEARVAVTLEPARAPELAPLIADAYGFTERERRVVELVARGFSTREIAARLHLSPYTVQDHLKSIFTRSGTGSRRELVARIFLDHYAPGLG